VRAVWRASLQFEQVRLELLQALRRPGYALRGTAACGLICACHASQVTLPMPLPLPCVVVLQEGVLHAAVLSAREHARCAGLAGAPHAHAGARSVLPGSGVAPVRRRWSQVVRNRLSPCRTAVCGRTGGRCGAIVTALLLDRPALHALQPSCKLRVPLRVWNPARTWRRGSGPQGSTPGGGKRIRSSPCR
jgi:hypothetical protein